MKQKLLLGLMIATMIFAGCGANNAQDPKSEPVSDETLEMEEESGPTSKSDDKSALENDSKEDASEETKDEAASDETASEDADFTFADVSNLEFYFSSGAGGWGTSLKINADGSFKGSYHDSDMGDIGEGYPNGTLYWSVFKGNFSNPVKVDDYTYEFSMENIEYEDPVDTQEIKDETLYVYTSVYGLEDTDKFYMYLPGKKVDDFDSELMMWLGYYSEDDQNIDGLPFYAIHNVKQNYGFTSYEAMNPSELAQSAIDYAKENADIIENRLQTEDMTQLDMNFAAADLYTEWDNALNTIWGLLKENLPADEFEKVLAEQRVWVEEKEKKVEEVGAEYEGGSMQPLIMHKEAAELTKKRVYELAEYLK